MMASTLSFDEILEEVNKLSPDAQEELAELVRRRNIERRRGELARESQEAAQEFHAGRCQPATVSEIIDEIES